MRANQPDLISAEDKDLIRAMVALPLENKFLARGIILGLGLANYGKARADTGLPQAQQDST